MKISLSFFELSNKNSRFILFLGIFIFHFLNKCYTIGSCEINQLSVVLQNNQESEPNSQALILRIRVFFCMSSAYFSCGICGIYGIMKARKKQAMEKQILKSHEGKERGYKISVNYNRDGEPCNVYVKKSVSVDQHDKL